MTLLISQLKKFATVGVVNTIIGTSLQFLVHRHAMISVEMSGYIGYSFASILSYFLNRYWTFQSTSRHRQTLFPFITQSLINALIYGKITGFLSTILPYMLAVSIGVLIMFFISFFVNRFIFTQKYISIT
jgi:putative flippase GtrA